MVVHFLEGEASAEVSERLKQKLVPREELTELGDFLRRRNMRIAYTSGAYDLIHAGHTRYLQQAKRLGDVLVVGLNSDKSIKSYKDPDRPILVEMHRAETLSSLEDVNYITIYDETTGADVIKILKPNAYLCVEGSWEGSLETKEEVEAMAQVGGEVFYTPRQSPLLSTSKIINRVILNKTLRWLTDMGYNLPSMEDIENGKKERL